MGWYGGERLVSPRWAAGYGGDRLVWARSRMGWHDGDRLVWARSRMDWHDGDRLVWARWAGMVGQAGLGYIGPR